ncbi:MAG: hypothetical protein ACRETN_08405 [Nevskiales bacterium]
MFLAAASAILFLLLHAAIERQTQDSFLVVFKLGRGIASVMLSAIGFYALFHWWELAPAGFMGRHAGDVLAGLLVQFIFGHFIADFILLAWGWWRARAKPRPDLVIHHALGLAGIAVVNHYMIGHALLLLLFTTEMMPVTSGLAGWAALKKNLQLERQAQKLRLAVLVLWRVPLWFVIGGLMIYNLFVLTPDPLLAVGYRFSLGFLPIVLGLDIFWIFQCLRGLRDAARPRPA